MVQTVVRKPADGVDTLIGEITNRQCLVLNAQHIAHPVIFVAKELQRRAVGLYSAALKQATIFGPIGQCCQHPVARQLLRDLSVSVVGYIRDQRLRPGLMFQLQMTGAQTAIEGELAEMPIAPRIDLFDHLALWPETPLGRCALRRAPATVPVHQSVRASPGERDPG